MPVAGHSLGGYVALAAASGNSRIRGVLALDVKSDWTEEDAALAARARGSSQRVSPDRRDLLDRLARSIAPVEVTDAELELLAERSIEPADGGWRFRWDRAVLDSEAVDPFPFLGDVPCPTHVMAGSLSDVMPPESARRFAEAIPGATLELVEGAGHHLELERPELVAERIRELAYSRDAR